MIDVKSLKFDEKWLKTIHINEVAINECTKRMLENSPEIGGQFETAWLLKAVTCTDLTTLAGDDTSSNVIRLCTKAVNPISKEILAKLHENEIEKKFLYDITTAAVCVYPSRVPDAVQHLTKLNAKLPVASVATGFPSGQYPLSTKLQEISYCVSQGASEIDVVIDRSLVLAQKWEQLYNEIKQMKIACGPAHMKTILAVGECGSFDNIYKASLVAMMAGSDFIKTSTGKESVNATLPVGLVMCRAIRNFHSMTGIKVGLKPAGGIRLCEDAINWLKLVKHELGSEWLNPKLFRIGASGGPFNFDENTSKPNNFPYPNKLQLRPNRAVKDLPHFRSMTSNSRSA